MTESIKIQQSNEVPKTQEERIKSLRELPLKQKSAFIPPVGTEFRMGPYVYQVRVTNPGQLRFTAALKDVIVDGVNDNEESIIINPSTGKAFA